MNLTISGIPFRPYRWCKVARIEEKFVLNPTNEELKNSQLDLVVVGIVKVLMVESEASELSEDVMLEAVDFGKQSYSAVLELIISVAKEAAKEPWTLDKS